MPISLFPHNQTAYESLLTVLETVQRACIIHPTGTGKSFIGFKYCEEHPTRTVLWLSPSAYIFKTQCESLLAAGAQVPENISYMTYAKLSQLDPAELNELRPDVIILDEMHRAAAPTWEKPVQALLARKPEPIAIGLTATNIRYLDGQKFTTVTFDMRIASEMTLGEAIVRGILNPPKYVLSLFTYQNELDKYEARVRQARSKAMKDKGEELLDALRRALEKAEGMDEIFVRHMPQANGKYIVFCANAEHMREMIGKAPEWFGKVDKHPPHLFRLFCRPRDEQRLCLLQSRRERASQAPVLHRHAQRGDPCGERQRRDPAAAHDLPHRIQAADRAGPVGCEKTGRGHLRHRPQYRKPVQHRHDRHP